MFQMRLLSSLHRVFPDCCPAARVVRLTAAANEPLSFQAAFRLEGEKPKSAMVNVRSECALPLSTYLVGYVPVLHTDTQDYGALRSPGLFPDMLLKKRTNPELVREGTQWSAQYYEKGEETLINAANDAWQSVWFTVNEDGAELAPGAYPVRIWFEEAETRAVLAEATAEVEILPVALLPQKLMYTNWFHCDCLADFYGVEVFSDRFFDIFGRFVRAAVRNGMNMLLTPAFTPPLDTPINSERRTVQLVKIVRENGAYSFDFSLMKRFLDAARAAGIEYFEHAHLFSQWGAKAAPKIIAVENGAEKRIFGWDTDASGPEYRRFLRAYLPAVTAFLKDEGLEKKTLFHISDEPGEGMEESYARAREAVGDLLEGFMVGDALSHYDYYEKGLVRIPICVTSTIDSFLGRCDDLWAYYTGGQYQDGLSNRILVCPSEQNRILGTELYANRIKGFLHWGYNYYYDRMSHGLFDPRVNPCGYNNHAGTTYFVYPGRNGEPIQSVRQKVFGEGLNDLRALETLESLKGREECDRIMRKHFGQVGFRVKPDSPEKLLAFREDVNQALAPH
ncbi:MAG: DUF4091 domain-containing protein [Clostridia bacterium]|nr:DUF4091 domain-containing protein [Clostridia bacterium]